MANETEREAIANLTEKPKPGEEGVSLMVRGPLPSFLTLQVHQPTGEYLGGPCFNGLQSIGDS